MYHVYFCNGVESTPAVIMPGFKPAIFDNEADAKNYVIKQSEGRHAVDPRDNCIEGTSRECWWEIYDGDMIENPGSDEEVLHDPIYTSPTYYTR